MRPGCAAGLQSANTQRQLRTLSRFHKDARLHTLLVTARMLTVTMRIRRMVAVLMVIMVIMVVLVVAVLTSRMRPGVRILTGRETDRINVDVHN